MQIQFIPNWWERLFYNLIKAVVADATQRVIATGVFVAGAIAFFPAIPYLLHFQTSVLSAEWSSIAKGIICIVLILLSVVGTVDVVCDAFTIVHIHWKYFLQTARNQRSSQIPLLSPGPQEIQLKRRKSLLNPRKKNDETKVSVQHTNEPEVVCA